MDAEIDRYWTHLASKGLPHTADKPGTGCVPMWLWGDDTRYNEQGAKIVLVAMGAVLDRRKSSKDTTYPLFAYQVDTHLLNKNAMNAYLCDVWVAQHFLGWSLESIHQAKEQSLGFETLQAFLGPVLWQR